MDSAERLVWLEVVPASGEIVRMGGICRRHADAMIVPRGWTLDDRRESRPRLFRVADSPVERMKPVRAARKRSTADQSGHGVVGEQLSFDVDGGPDEITVGDIRPLASADVDETQAVPWRFEFDDSDDLGGLLQTDSPLLSRAFRGPQRRQ